MTKAQQKAEREALEAYMSQKPEARVAVRSLIDTLKGMSR